MKWAAPSSSFERREWYEEVNLSPLHLQWLFFFLLWLLVICSALTLGIRRGTATQPATQPVGVQPVSQPVGVQPANQPVGVQPISQPAGVQSTNVRGGVSPIRARAPEIVIERPPVDGVTPPAERLIISSGRVIIGRAAAADIKIDDEFASSQHAAIHQSGGRLRVEDLGSRNGTFVNNLPLQGTADLKTGDTVSIGKTIIRIL